jgi:hypothetical protein
MGEARKGVAVVAQRRTVPSGRKKNSFGGLTSGFTLGWVSQLSV